MTGNIALDVAIGLTFVFVLYSLLASVIAEIIASFFGLRARNLQTGISRLLEEDKKGLIQQSPREILFLRKLIDFVNDLIAPLATAFQRKDEKSTVNQFYKHPAIKYLAKDKFFSKPSYIHPSTFSKVVMDILKEKENEDDTGTPLERIQKKLELYKDSTLKIEALEAKLKNETAAENRTILKSQIRKLKSDSFLHGDTCKLLTSYLEDANNDLDKFQESLESWFNNTMDRVRGWYKRKNQFILLVIGLFLAIKFNANTVEIAKRLSKDEQARTEMVGMATAFVEENPDLVNRINGFKNDSLDSSLQQDVQLMNDRLDSLIEIKKELHADIDEASNVLGQSLPDSLLAKPVKKAERNKAAESIEPNQVFINDSNYIITFPDKYMAANAGRYYEIRKQCGSKKGDAIYAYPDMPRYWWANILGYLITALAISLGAPFWFDLLNKLVKLRGSAQQSTGSGGAAGGKKNSKPTETPVG